MNTQYRKRLPNTELDYFDTREAVNAIEAGAYEKLPYTSRVLAENLVRRCDPAVLTDSLKQLIERKQDLDFPWYPARVVTHDILGQTALVDLAGLRDAIADMGGDPAKVNPVVVLTLMPLLKTVPLKTVATKTVFTLSSGQKRRLKMLMLSQRVTASCTKSIWRKCLL